MRRGQIRYIRGYRPRRYPRKRKDKSFRKFKVILAWILFLVLVLSYVLFFSPLFKIKEIKISDNRAISNEEIQNSLANFNNVFLTTNNKLRKTLLNDFSQIASIDINKNIVKKTISLKIVERKEVGIFCKSECYYIDEGGVIFEKAPQTSGTLILVIKDSSGGQAELGSNVIDKDFLEELVDLRKRLSEQLNLKVLDFTINSEVSKDLKINTNEGWYILLDRSRNIEEQVRVLRLVLEEKIKEERDNLEYIDLRIENRAYYK